MYLIYRHLLASAAGPFFFGWFVITFLLMIDVLYRYVDLFVSKGVPFILATRVLGLSLGYTFALSIPMAVLIAVLMSVGQLATDHEITAMKSCGISLWAVLRPLLFGAMVIGAALTAYNHYILPESNHTLASLLYDINRKKPMLEIREHQFTDLSDRMTIYVGSKDDLTGKIKDVKIFEKEKPGDLSPRLTIAESGTIITDHESNSMVIELYNGETHEIPDKEQPDKYQVTRFGKQTLHLNNMERDFKDSGRKARGDREMDLNDLKAAAAKENEHQLRVGQRVREINGGFLDSQLRLLDPKHRQIALGKSPAPAPGPARDSFLARKFKATTTAIQRSIEQARHQVRLRQSYVARENRYLVEFHKKFAIPFACVIFALIGIPMAVTTSRSGKGVSVSLALGVYLIYYAFLMGGEKLADKAKLDPFVAMWSANFFLLGLGIPMFLRAASETGFRPFWRRPPGPGSDGPPSPPEPRDA